MDHLRNLRIGARLGLAFASVLVLTVLLGVFATLQLARVNQTSTDIELNWLPSVRGTAAMAMFVSDLRVGELQHILSTDDKAMAGWEAQMTGLLQKLEKERSAYEKLISSPEERQLYDRFKGLWTAYLAEHDKVLALSRQNRNEEATTLIRGESQKRFEELDAVLDQLIALNAKGADDASRQGDVLYANARLWVMAGLVLAVGLGGGLAWWVTGSLTGPIARAVTVARTVAAGDLSAHIDVQGRDELAELLSALKSMNDSLVDIVSQVRLSSDSIATGSSQIASGNADLSQRTEEQASNLEQTAASMEQMTANVRQSADTASTATQLAQSASQAAGRGGEVVGRVVTTMDEISASSRRIADIIGTIDGIAFQTNILALNAAVEAARAGEQGRGFAVVAGEVRTLAQRSADAAREIKGLIHQSVEKVSAGAQLVSEAGASIGDVVHQVQRVADMITEIGAATQEQSQGMGQVNEAVTQLDQVTQQNAALVEQSAAAAESLKQQAGKLAALVGTFRLASARGLPAAVEVLPAATRRPMPSAAPAVRPQAAVRAAPAPAPAPALALAAPSASKAEADWETF
ncbi:methyl-accepting chemotaxis protein [Ideonella sp. DXS22W]|uniref:Methyl-accepting chemotaxis protein n=1 Tax=Pseudaquabacterium inlustre TaxID=2984192 RepID=A0ABU9CDS0_9BURK